MKRTAFRLIAGSVLMLAIALGFAQGAGAQDTGTSLTVHHRLCGDNYHGGDPFTECHDVLVGTAFDFTIDGPVNETLATNVATGDVTFADIPAGTYSLFGGVPGEFSTQNIYCSDSITGEALDISNGVPVAEGAAVVCDVYEFPEDLSGNTPTPAPAQPTSTPKPNSTVTTLPSTGTGVDSSSNEALWLIIPAALAIGGLGLVSKRRLSC
jgi:hypothetical protein